VCEESGGTMAMLGGGSQERNHWPILGRWKHTGRITGLESL
jgi:hypothetical protein